MDVEVDRIVKTLSQSDKKLLSQKCHLLAIIWDEKFGERALVEIIKGGPVSYVYHFDAPVPDDKLDGLKAFVDAFNQSRAGLVIGLTDSKHMWQVRTDSGDRPPFPFCMLSTCDDDDISEFVMLEENAQWLLRNTKEKG